MQAFELEDHSFPPLPGSSVSTCSCYCVTPKYLTCKHCFFNFKQTNASANGIFENKMSDVVRGTAKMTVSAGTSTSPSATPPSSNRASTASDVTAPEVEASVREAGTNPIASEEGEVAVSAGAAQEQPIDAVATAPPQSPPK